MDNEEKIIEVAYSDVKEESKTPFYYTTSQVSLIIGETDSTVRLWCDNFFTGKNEVSMSGRNRAFTQENIDKFKTIKVLIREKGFSHKQIIEYFNKGEEDLLKDISVSKNDPLAVQMIAVALAKEVNDNIGSIIKDLMFKISEREEEIQKQNQQQINELKSTIGKLTEKIDNQNKSMDEKELEAKNRDLEIIELIKSRQEERKLSSNENKRGFFNKLFGKNSP